jgi:CheY-like chemotaxis protein
MLLLADGSITIQRVIELTFAHEDVRVTSVSDGRRAVQILETEQPDVVLVDVDLPEMDGYTLAAHIRRIPRLKGVPILLLAGAFEPVDQARAREVGSDGVIMKPFEPQVVVTRVKELIDQRDRMAVPISRPVVDLPVPSAPVQTTPNVRSTPPAPAPEPPAPEAKPGRDSAFLRMAPRDRENEVSADAPALETLELPTRPIWEGQSGSPVGSSTPSLAPSFPQMVPVATAAPPLPSAPAAAPAPKVTLASAFTALLAAEQSSSPQAAPVAAMSEASIEDAVRRVLVRMTDDLVRRIVVDTAERLIREEIEKIKANPD